MKKIQVTKRPENTDGSHLAHNQYYDQGCTCSYLLGYNVHPEYPNEWAEKLISKDEGCILHGPRSNRIKH